MSLVQGKLTSQCHSSQVARNSVDVKSRMEELILGPTSARSEMIRRRLNGKMDACLSLT